MKLNGCVPARGGNPGGMHAINHVSGPTENTPACLCLSTIATALQKEKNNIWGYVRWFLALHPTLWHLDHKKGPELLVRLCLWVTSSQNLASKSLEFLAWEAWNGPGALTLLVYFPPRGVFCFNSWQKKVPFLQPEDERLVGYVLKNWDFFFFGHQFMFQEGELFKHTTLS